MQLNRALADIKSNRAIDNKGLVVFTTQESLLNAKTPSQALEFGISKLLENRIKGLLKALANTIKMGFYL
ncbi:hypothetical protein PZA11_001237 [Diplocarpon coronariae]